MKIFSSALDVDIDLQNIEYTIENILDDFYQMYDEKGAFWGIKDDCDRIIQFYWLEADMWLVDIPNPPLFKNYQKISRYDECVDIIKKVLREGKVVVIEGMVQKEAI